jgi:hypothetical protein
MTPFAAGLKALHKQLAECRKSDAGVYKVTNEPRYQTIMVKLDAYVANARLQYPEYFYSDRELKIMDKVDGKNFTRLRNTLDR